MKSIGQLFLGLLTALGSSVLVIAATSLSLLESGVEIAQAPTAIATLTTQEPALEPLLPEQPTPTQVPATATSACPYPEGWVVYAIVPGDTLESLAQEWNTAAATLYEGNCLPSVSLVAGTNLYHPLPSTATSTATETAAATPVPESSSTMTPTRVLCGPPAGWITYIVKPGDNLFRIGLAYGVTVDMLKFANCLRSDEIRAGQRLYVPNVPTRVPSPTPKTPAPTDPPVVETTEVPVKTTEAPVETTEAPVETTEAPANTAAAPEETVEAPAETAGAPAG